MEDYPLHMQTEEESQEFFAFIQKTIEDASKEVPVPTYKTYTSDDSLRHTSHSTTVLNDDLLQDLNVYFNRIRMIASEKIQAKIQSLGYIPFYWPSSCLFSIRTAPDSDDKQYCYGFDYFGRDFNSLYRKEGDKMSVQGGALYPPHVYRVATTYHKHAGDPQYSELRGKLDKLELEARCARSHLNNLEENQKSTATFGEFFSFLIKWGVVGGLLGYTAHLTGRDFPDTPIVGNDKAILLIVGLIGLVFYLFSDFHQNNRYAQKSRREIPAATRDLQETEAAYRAYEEEVKDILPAAQARHDKLVADYRQLEDRWHQAWWDSCQRYYDFP